VPEFSVDDAVAAFPCEITVAACAGEEHISAATNIRAVR
jgi:hypothetical protein